MLPITKLPRSLRPREKLATFGIDHLSTNELLTLILGSGSQKTPVHSIAQKISVLMEKQKQIQLGDLITIDGVGVAKAAQIIAALEIRERFHPSSHQEKIDSTQKALVHLFELRSSPREQVIGLYLNARYQLEHKEVLSIGAMNQAHITPREIFGVIKSKPILNIILAHNHPSGDPEPSMDDILFTKQMKDAGNLLGIELIDHIILARNTYFSFKESGKM